LRLILGTIVILGFAPVAGAESAPASGLSPLVNLLGQVDDPAFQLDVLTGMYESLEGRRDVTMPAGWPPVYQKLAASPNAHVREKAMVLAVIFGDREAIDSLKRTALDGSADAPLRQTALQALVQHRDPQLVPILRKLVADPALRGHAVRGLAAYDDPATPALILQHYRSFTAREKSDAVDALSSRRAYALALLRAVERGDVPSGDLSTFHVRQLMAFKQPEINALLEKSWGTLRPTAKDKAALIAQYKSQLAPAALQDADRARGRLVYSQICVACHRLFDEGGQIGPDLTGGQRANLDYVLENLLDPNAIIGRDFQMTIIQTDNGRVVTGIVKQETDKTVTIQTTNERIVIPKSEIEERQRSPLSMMPEGILAKLTPEQIRNLMAYLGGTGQVPLPSE
jgi:putative heme-binding domain-containing protein